MNLRRKLYDITPTLNFFYPKTYQYKPLHLFFLLFFISLQSVAQSLTESHRYSGNFRLSDSIQGTAVFNYYLSEGDTIRHGDFRFQQFIEHYLDSDTIHGFVLNGTFDNNIKNGPWRYVSRDFTISGNPQALDARVVYDVTGKEFLINTSFSKGLAHGDYEILDRNIHESQPSDTSFYVRFGYENGEVRGSLQGFSNHLEVQGYFDEEGFPDGDWTITHLIDSVPPITEIRRYDHGFFSKHFYQIADEMYEIHHIGFDTLARSGLGLLTRIPVTSTYFRALDYTDIVMDTTAVQPFFEEGNFQNLIARSNHFLERVMVNPAMHDNKNVWTKVEGNTTIKPMMIKISRYAYTDEELALNKSSERYLTETLSLLKSFLSEPNIRIARFSQENLAIYFRLMEIYENRLTKLSPVIHFLMDEASEYVDHNAILKHHIVDISYPNVVEYDFQDTTKTEQYNFPPSISNFSIIEINTQLEFIFEDVNKLIQKSSQYIEDFKVQSDLYAREEKLIQLKDSIVNLFALVDTNDNSYHELHRQLKPTIDRQVEQVFKSYSTLPLQQRLLEVGITIECYQQYVQLYGKLTDFDTILGQIDEEYTRSVWNAFTYTYMEERVKERLYKIYEESILPYYIGKLKNHESCEDLQQGITDIEKLLQRMMDLRMEDTRNLERQLRHAPKEAKAYVVILGLEV